jgi:hypothetical protein
VPRREAVEDLREKLVGKAFHGKGGAFLRRMCFRDLGDPSAGRVDKKAAEAEVAAGAPSLRPWADRS